MKVQLYTLSEITETLRHLSQHEDSITETLKAGDFRWRFEAHVAETRAKRDEENLFTLQQRLIPTTQDGKDVFLLDDIQGAVSKKQFARFMKFLKKQDAAINIVETTYIPTDMLERFIQQEQQVAFPEVDEDVNVELLRFA